MNISRFVPCWAGLVAMTAQVNAQPDPTAKPKGDNPTNRPVLTPEQRLAEGMRRQLVAANVTDQKQQAAVIAYVAGELEARRKLADSARALSAGLRNANTSDAQIAGLLNDYVAALQDDKARHQKALDGLKAAITVSQFPRLEAGLTLLGVWNDAPVLSANPFGGGGRPNRRGAGGNRNGNAANGPATRPVPF